MRLPTTCPECGKDLRRMEPTTWPSPVRIERQDFTIHHGSVGPRGGFHQDTRELWDEIESPKAFCADCLTELEITYA